MLNSTIISLNLLSFISSSPLLALSNSQKGVQLSLFNSHISRSFTSLIYSSIVDHKTILMNDVFSHTLSSVINFHTNDINVNCSLYQNFDFSPNTPIGGQIINKTHSYFIGGCGNITITGCIFNESTSKLPGGAICIEQDCFVIIHNTIFNYCSSKNDTGGACYIAQKNISNPPNFKDEPVPQMDIQYCCFQNCFGGSNLYGVAVFSSAKNTILYYASTTNCPGQEGQIVSGAQFDLQATNVTSQYVNATGAHSNYCGGIEYRRATEGFFRFQTISSMTCRFAVAYTNIQTRNLSLYESNIMNITLVGKPNTGDPLYPGLIHVRYTDKHKESDIIIRQFCFINNNFKEPNSTIISKATSGGKICNYHVFLDDCYYDCSDKFVEVTEKYLATPMLENCHQNTKTLNDIPQLNLGECKGKVTAAPLTPSPSNGFTESTYFTNSNDFTNSNAFTNSDAFTNSNDFTNSIVFTQSNPFTRSSKLRTNSPSNTFSNSNRFTKSSPFSDSFSTTPIAAVYKDQKSDNKIAIIAGASAAGAAAVAAAVVGAIFFLKKPPKIEDINTIKETNNQTNNENPIFDRNAEEDPFRDDFQN